MVLNFHIWQIPSRRFLCQIHLATIHCSGRSNHQLFFPHQVAVLGEQLLRQVFYDAHNSFYHILVYMNIDSNFLGCQCLPRWVHLNYSLDCTHSNFREYLVVTIHQVHQEFLLQVVSYATMLLPQSRQCILYLSHHQIQVCSYLLHPQLTSYTTLHVSSLHHCGNPIQNPLRRYLLHHLSL